MDNRIQKTIIRRRCCVPCCKGEGTHFHRFPRQEDLRAKWINACKITKKVTQNMYICSLHFRKEDYLPDLDPEWKKLRKLVVPSQNIPTNLEDIESNSKLQKLEELSDTSASAIDDKFPEVIFVEQKRKSTIDIPSDSKKQKFDEVSSTTETVTQDVKQVISSGDEHERSDIKKCIDNPKTVSNSNLQSPTKTDLKLLKTTINKKQLTANTTSKDGKFTTVIYVPKDCSNLALENSSKLNIHQLNKSFSDIPIIKQESKNVCNLNPSMVSNCKTLNPAGNNIQKSSVATNPVGSNVQSLNVATDPEGNNIQTLNVTTNPVGNKIQSLNAAANIVGNNIQKPIAATNSVGNTIQKLNVTTNPIGSDIQKSTTVINPVGNSIQTPKVATNPAGSNIQKPIPTNPTGNNIKKPKAATIKKPTTAIIQNKDSNIQQKSVAIKKQSNRRTRNSTAKSVLKTSTPILNNRAREEIIIKKEERVHITIHKRDDKSIILKRHDNHNNSLFGEGVSSISMCAVCKCKIKIEDSVDTSKKDVETLAAETLLELQEVNPLNENERITLIKIGIEICNKALQKKNIDLMELLAYDNELVAFTGVNFELLGKLTRLVTLFEGSSAEKKRISVRNRVVICLCKLRTNLSFPCLALLFGIKPHVCESHFIATIQSLSTLLDKTIYWPETEEMLKNLPESVQSFKHTRVILNCTEIQAEKPICTKCEVKINLSKKEYQIYKLVLGIAPSGLFIFKAKVFKEHPFDNSIFTQTNILEKLDPTKDAIMTDESLENIEAECTQHNIMLIKLPTPGKNSLFNSNEVGLIKNICAARIYVERSLHRLRMYKIMQTIIPWRITPYVNDMCTIVAGLVNMNNPISIDESALKSTAMIRK